MFCVSKVTNINKEYSIKFCVVIDIIKEGGVTGYGRREVGQ